jgi:hypothetical protein
MPCSLSISSATCAMAFSASAVVVIAVIRLSLLAA